MAEKPARLPNLTLEGAKLFSRNFAGEQGRYNAKGDRNFCVRLDPELADALREAGWNIKTLKPREDASPEERPQDFVQVKVNFDSAKPPRIYLISSRGRTLLGEAEMLTVDVGDFTNVDLIINPYQWTIEETGASGIKAYLVTMYATLEEDDLDRKYADVPDSFRSGVRFIDDSETGGD